MVILIFWILACFIIVEAEQDKRWWTPQYDQLCRDQTPNEKGKYQALMREFNQQCSVFCYFNGKLLRTNHVNVPDGTSCNTGRVCQHGDCVDNAIVDVCRKLYNTSKVTALEGTCKQVCSRNDNQGSSVEQKVVLFTDGTPCIAANVQEGRGHCFKGECKDMPSPTTTTASPQPPKSDVTKECEKSYDNSDGLLVGEKDPKFHGCKYHCYKQGKQLTTEGLPTPNGAECGNNKAYSCNEGACLRKADITQCNNLLGNTNGRVLLTTNGCAFQCQQLSKDGQPGRVSNWNVEEWQQCYADIGVKGICREGGCYELTDK